MTTDHLFIAPAPGHVRIAVPPTLLALLYPVLLAMLFRSAEMLHHDGNPFDRLLVTFVLLAIFAVPLLALISAIQLGAIETSSSGDATARRFAHLAFASPPLFTLIGVLSYMAGWPHADVVIWAFIWLFGAAFVYWHTRDSSPAASIKPRPAWLRVSHGIVAAVILTGFISLHFVNHIAGLWGAETHIAVMKMLRLWYRSFLVEPALVALMLFMVVSGFILLWAKLSRTADAFTTLQTTTGAYLLFYIPGHMNSVFVFQRSFLGKDSDFWFAAGGTGGVLGDPWSVRLLPHYALGVWAITTHAACGLRQVLIAHGVQTAMADRATLAFSGLGAVLAVAMVLPLCRVHPF
jgi:hypothetical protein